MRLMILAAGAAFTLTACGGNKTQNDAANMSADTNMMGSDSNGTMDSNMSTDANMMGANAMDANASGGADANMATNAATENAMKQKDMNTHDPDTNLKNGM